MIRFLVPFALVLGLAAPAMPASPATSVPPGLVEPKLSFAKGGGSSPRVALTFDACMGKTDYRILSVLIDEKIPATIFVTARWMRNNPDAVMLLKTHPNLFDVENHGENHVPAINMPASIYGIPAAGTPEAVEAEVAGGAMAIKAAGFNAPRWFRGATAIYSPTAIAGIRRMGSRVAGYSINGDGGSLLGAKAAEARIVAARDGDVVIAHVNQPTREAGEGVARAIRTLKAKGYTFVRLNETTMHGTDGTVK